MDTLNRNTRPTETEGNAGPAWLPGQIYEERFWIGVLAVMVTILLLLYMRFIFIVGVDHDEVEHAHASFRILMGEIPYRDFYQNHWPTYWLLVTQFVKAFPFSVKVILAGRAFNLLVLAGVWYLGLRLLRQIPGGLSRFSILIYTAGLIFIAVPMQAYVARPDPLMVLIGTAGLCLVPMNSALHYRRAFGLGVLFGLSISVSTKILPFALIVPTLIVVQSFREKTLKSQAGKFLAKLTSYGLGVFVGLLPVAIWIFQTGLMQAFFGDVFVLNAATAKPWYRSFDFLSLTIYTPSILGLLAWYWARWSRNDRDENGFLIVAFSFASGLALAFLARHSSVYNLQMMMVPLAVTFAALSNVLWVRIQELGYRLLAIAAILAFPVTQASTYMALIGTEMKTPIEEMQAIIDLAEPGLKTCTAFSPTHPVFCQSVSRLSNNWDLFFLETIEDPRQLQRFHEIWSEGIQNTIELQPDLILRRREDDFWEKAVSLGVIDQGDLDKLDGIQHGYNIVMIGDNEFWVKKTADRSDN